MKCVAETMDGAGTVLVDPAAYASIRPDFTFPADGVHIRLRDHAIPQEERLRHYKLPAALAFARANGLNRIVMDSPHARFGIAARGRGYATLRQALHDAGITEELARHGRPAHLEGRAGLAAGWRGRARIRPRGSRRSWWSRTAAR